MIRRRRSTAARFGSGLAWTFSADLSQVVVPAHVTIGNQVYFRSSDGTIMPMKKDQPPPDLKYFKRGRTEGCRPECGWN
jgi:hypothetical protein